MYTLQIYGKNKPKSGEFIALFEDLEELIVTACMLVDRKNKEYYKIFDQDGKEVKEKYINDDPRRNDTGLPR